MKGFERLKVSFEKLAPTATGEFGRKNDSLICEFLEGWELAFYTSNKKH